MTSTKRLLSTLTVGLGLGLAAVFVAPQPAAAFCGFYVAGADAKLFNDATMVVMMRDGKRTVLSMQNDYQGPPEDFALIIPVPVVLQEGDVKTLPKAVFDHVDKLAAPRLVEYWERDPCEARRRQQERRRERFDDVKMDQESAAPGEYGVTIEAEFTVGEYEVVILSAEDSTGLDTWLRQEEYNIPESAEPVLRPYVEGGMKFFVAKVDAQKVEFAAGPDGKQHAMLSPLRFHYDSEDFSLPVRLGLINAQGPQDLLVHILAPNQRYEAANYENVTIPTNLVVKDEVRERFGEFYVSLFDHTLAQAPKAAVVTEYSWSAGSCDPCPEPPLSRDELVVLGADVLPRYAEAFDAQGQLDEAHEASWQIGNDFVLTRLHARYDKASLGEDLVFAQAGGLSGGQGMPRKGKLNAVTHESGDWNSFQGRYAILHHWDGPVRCFRPLRDQWGGPPDGGGNQPAVARELAFVNRDASLGSFVTAAAHVSLGLAGEPPEDDRPKAVQRAEAREQRQDEQAQKAQEKGCACATSTADSTPGAPLLGGLALLSLLGLERRRRRA